MEYGIPELVKRSPSFRSLVPPLWQATHLQMAAIELTKLPRVGLILLLILDDDAIALMKYEGTWMLAVACLCRVCAKVKPFEYNSVNCALLLVCDPF